MNKFDHILWRINGIAILLGAFLFGCFCLYTAYRVLFWTFEPREQNIAFVNEETQQSGYLRLGEFSPVDNVNAFYAPLESYGEDGNSSNYSSSYHSSNTVNYLFLDRAENKAAWLAPGNSWRFLRLHKLYEDIEAKKKKTVGFIYKVIREDTNQDNSLDAKDKHWIYYSRANGSGFIPLLKAIDVVLGVEQVNNNYVMFFYQNGSKTYYSEIEIGKTEPALTRELPAIIGAK